MPKTYRLSTAEQIARIRDGLLPPLALFATIEELFLSRVAGGIDHKAASKNERKKRRLWTCDGKTKVMAHTKSEARAAWKKENGPIPKGLAFKPAGEAP